jgi:hypothetical protein
MESTTNPFGHIPKLTSKNYDVWSIRAEAILWKARLWNLVSVPLPASEPTTITDPDSKQQDACTLVQIISDEILNRLTTAEQIHGQKLWHRLATVRFKAPYLVRI